MALFRKSEIVVASIILIFALCGAVSAISGDPGSNQPLIRFFIPEQGSIHSSQINGMINGHNGTDIFATSFGLSTYNGSWSTLHINRDNISEGLLNDYITAVAYDSQGNLWIGYSGGVQIYNGVFYTTFRDQQLLKDPRINALQRWDDSMWVATGNAGLHRYRSGVWDWWQPETPNGSPFYTVTGMAVDTSFQPNGSLIIATADEGVWEIPVQNDPVQFLQLPSGESFSDPLSQMTRDINGGVYLFNHTTVVHYSDISGFSTLLTSSAFSEGKSSINAVTSASDGSVYIGTDNGIYVWRNGGIEQRISGLDGLGPSNIVKFLFADNENRVWYATQGYVGFVQVSDLSATEIPIVVPTPVPSLTPGIVPSQQIPALAETTPESASPVSGIIDPLIDAVKALFAKFGIQIG